MKMLTMYITDQTAHSVPSDRDLHCPQKFPLLSSVRKELNQCGPLLSDNVVFISVLLQQFREKRHV